MGYLIREINFPTHPGIHAVELPYFFELLGVAQPPSRDPVLVVRCPDDAMSSIRAIRIVVRCAYDSKPLLPNASKYAGCFYIGNSIIKGYETRYVFWDWPKFDDWTEKEVE